jgi:hypothetical protein
MPAREVQASEPRLESADQYWSGRGEGAQHQPAEDLCGVLAGRRSVRRGRGVARPGSPASRRWSGRVMSGERHGRNRPLVGSSHRASGPGDRRSHRSRAQVASRARGQTARDQVFVRGAPHRARRLLLPPTTGALGAVALLVRFVRGEQRSPSLGQPRELGSSHREQGRGVSLTGQLCEQVQSLPHRVAEDLSKDLVHRNVTVTFPPARRLRVAQP